MLHNGVGEGAVDAESKLSSLFEFLSGMKRDEEDGLSVRSAM